MGVRFGLAGPQAVECLRSRQDRCGSMEADVIQLLPEKTEGCGTVLGSSLSQDGMLGRDGALVSGP